MKKKTWHSYAKSHYLVNRINDNLHYFHFFDNDYWKNKNTKEHIQNHLNDVAFVETLSKYFEKKLKKNKKNAEIRINLTDLIYDLNTLKQYL